MYRTPVIVQVSDLHFGKNANPFQFFKSAINVEVKETLRQALLTIEPRPDFLVVTGDVANRGKIEEMKEGRAFLESILDGLWNLGQATRCILVPGNHDTWGTTWAGLSGYSRRADRLVEWNEVFPGWSFVAPTLPKDKGEDIRPFLLTKYFQTEQGKNAEDSAAQTTKALLACEYFPSFNLVFLKLDSNVCPGRPAHIARGMVGLPQRRRVEEVLNHYQRATAQHPAPFGDACRVALVHHHVTRLPNVKLENWMMMDDAGEVARWLATLGIRLVLHGHFHWADSIGIKYWNTESNNSLVETIIISAGSATAVGADDGHNSYHYMTLGSFRSTLVRPTLDFGVNEPLAKASRFEFIHEPNLKLQSDSTSAPPVFLEALKTLALEEEKYGDKKHTYNLVKSYGYIDSDRNYLGNVELYGKNGTTQASEYIPFSFVAIGAQLLEDCECKCMDLDDGTELEKKPLEHHPIHMLPFRIFKHVPADGDFKLRLSFLLKMVMLKESDYDVVSLLRFPRGVKRMEFGLLSEMKILNPSLWELRGNSLKQSKCQLEPIQRKPESSKLRKEMGGFGITVDSPPALAYVLLYDALS